RSSPQGDFLDYLTFVVPEERIFYLALPEIDSSLRYFVLAADGRAGEIPISFEPQVGNSSPP
ncbi:MAG: hypothetical protein O7A98_06150, partial [Acidobacteria bacterium]|nr:hypothetical protein [Acidobacteriota bacterium]